MVQIDLAGKKVYFCWEIFGRIYVAWRDGGFFTFYKGKITEKTHLNKDGDIVKREVY